MGFCDAFSLCIILRLFIVTICHVNAKPFNVWLFLSYALILKFEPSNLLGC